MQFKLLQQAIETFFHEILRFDRFRGHSPKSTEALAAYEDFVTVYRLLVTFIRIRV